MIAERTAFGETREGKAELCTIRSGRYRVSATTYGASLVWFGTEERNYVTCHADASLYESDTTYMGCTVGPYANRIDGARFTLDGKEHILEKNDGENNLHSGSTGFCHKNWTVAGQSMESVTFSLVTEDGEGGFPGLHETEVTYIISGDGILTISYRARSDRKCPVALTNHAYFVLSSDDCRSVKVTIPAESYVSVKDDLIPWKENPVAVEGTAFDFRTPHAIGERRGGRYDNTWVLEKNAVVEAEGDRAKLSIRTTEPGIQMYTGEFFTGPDAFVFGGLALETGLFPDTPNRPDFPQAFTVPGETFTSVTSYRLEIKE